MVDERKYNELAGVNAKEKEQQAKAREERKEEEAKREEPKHESKLTFEDSVIEKIAAIACHEVPGVLDMKGGFFSGVTEQFGGYDITKGVSADVGKEEAIINASIILEYGQSAPKVFEKLKESITQQVGQMTGLRVVEVNVKVDDVMTRKEFDQKQRKDSEKAGNSFVGGLR